MEYKSRHILDVRLTYCMQSKIQKNQNFTIDLGKINPVYRPELILPGKGYNLIFGQQ